MTDEIYKDDGDKQEGNGPLSSSVGSLVAPRDGLLQPVGLPSDLSVDGPVQDGQEQDDQGVENYCSRRSHLKVLLLSREDFCEGNFSEIFLEPKQKLGKVSIRLSYVAYICCDETI